MIEVFAKVARGHGLLKIAICGAQDPCVRLQDGIAPQALEGAVLQDPQNLRLDHQRDVADFIQKDRAATGLLELSDPPCRGAGEGARLVAKKLAFQQGLRDGRAVDDHQRHLISPAVLINRACHQFLARARLAADEYGGVGCGDSADRLVELLHGRTLPDDSIIRSLRRLGPQVPVPLHQPERLQRLGNGLQHLGRFKGL